jgi:hypothetical protein
VDGVTACRRLRDDGIWSSLLLLTARDSIEDRVAQREYALLYALMSSPGVVLDRFELIERAWGSEYETRSNSSMSTSTPCATRFDKPFDVTSIETVRGAGLPDPRRRPAPVTRLSVRVRVRVSGQLDATLDDGLRARAVLDRAAGRHRAHALPRREGQALRMVTRAPVSSIAPAGTPSTTALANSTAWSSRP